jgi:hypothetical protein
MALSSVFLLIIIINEPLLVLVAGIINFFGQTGAFLMSIFFGRIVALSGSFDAPEFLKPDGRLYQNRTATRRTPNQLFGCEMLTELACDLVPSISK